MNVFKMNKPHVTGVYSPLFYDYYERYFLCPNLLIRKIVEMKTLLTRVNAKDGVFVDLGGGFGLESVVLSFISNMEIICVDHSEEKIRIGELFAKAVDTKNVEFIHEKGENLPEDLKADTMLCRDVISHVYDINRFFDKITENIKKKGGALHH